MDEDLNELEIGYLSYNALNKPAFFAGVPLMMMIFLLSAFLFICFPLYMFLGKTAGTISAVFLVAVYIFTKFNCDNDANAMRVITIKLKGYIQYGFKNILGVRG